MRDILLDTDTHDLVVSDNDLQFCSDNDEIAQSIKQELLFFEGEWYLNINLGIPYFDKVLIKAPRSEVVNHVFKEAIRGVEGVLSILDYSMEFDPDERKSTVRFEVTTIYDDVLSGAVEI